MRIILGRIRCRIYFHFPALHRQLAQGCLSPQWYLGQMWARVLGQGWDEYKEMFLLAKHPAETQSRCSQALLAYRLLLLLLTWEKPNVHPTASLPHPYHQSTRSYLAWPSAMQSKWNCGHTSPLEHLERATPQIMHTPSNQNWPGAEVFSQSSSHVVHELTVLVLLQKMSVCKSFWLSNSRQALFFISSKCPLAILFLWGPRLEFSQGLGVLSHRKTVVGQAGPAAITHRWMGQFSSSLSNHSCLDKATAKVYFQLLLGVEQPLPHSGPTCTQSAEKWWNSPFPKDFQQMLRGLPTLHNLMDTNLLLLYTVYWWKQPWNNTR